MKNLKIAQLLGCLFLLIVVNIQKSSAITSMDIESVINTSDSELQYDVLEVMDEFQAKNEIEEVSVEILDQDFNVIAFGVVNEYKIERLISKSDLLTEITGKKFFRLCYENE
jgi:hypothetical protein